MNKDIRSNRDNHFDGMTVKKRVIDLGDRSISISNIASISIAETSPSILLIVLAIIGTLIMLSSGMDLGSAFRPDQTKAFRAVVGLLFLAPIIFFLITKKVYLIIASNDGSKAVFTTKDINFLRHVKTALDEKINSDNLGATFEANFAEGSIQQMNIDQVTSENIIADAVVSNSPGSFVAAHSPGAQLGDGNVMKDSTYQTTRQGAENAAFHSTNSLTHEALHDPAQQGQKDLLNKSLDWLTQKATGYKTPYAPAQETQDAGPTHTFVPQSDLPPGQQPQRDQTSFEQNGSIGQAFTDISNPQLETSAIHGDGGAVAYHSPGAQIGDFNTQENTQTFTDYSLHIPRVETVRDGLNDPALKAKLDEMLQLMKDGTTQDQDKQKLKQYALDMASFVQAYPPITRIFNDLIRVIGV